MTDIKIGIVIIQLFFGIVGIGNGLISMGNGCSSQYLDLRKPIHYIVIGHTAGFYLGKVLGYPYGETREYKICGSIFNETLEGRAND
jgi:hypothetical protein